MTAAASRLVVSQVDTAILALVSFCRFPESLLTVTKAKQGASSTFDAGQGLVTGKQRICHALARLGDTHKLAGATPEEEAQVLQWTSFCNTHVDPAAATGAKANGVTVLKTINEHLSANTHLVANRLSLADIMVSTAVQPILAALEVSLQSGVSNVTSWYGRIQSETGNALPALKLKTPEDELAEQMAAAKVAEDKAPEKQKKKEKPAPAKAAPAPELPELSLLDIRVGKIVHVEKHPDADALYVEKIDVGEGAPRTICSGLVKYMTPDQLQDRSVLVLCNLKPVNMRGIQSQGMLLAASDTGKTVVEPLDPPANSRPGDAVTFAGFERQPADVLNPKKKIWEKVQPEFKTDASGVAHYQDIPFAVSGGQVTAATVRNGNIS